MKEILAAVLASMHADIGRMDRIGMNIANASTAGYKREVAGTLPFAARVEAADGTGEARTAAAHLDLRAGTLKATGQSLDLAVAGNAWFEVATEHGPAYTRRGDFRLDARARLVTQQGLPVLGTSGEIQLPHGAPYVDANGQVFASAPSPGEHTPPLAQIKLLVFEVGTAMERGADGLMLTRADGAAPREGAVQVQQGYLENSNVSHMHEMVRLLGTMRHMETLQKVALG